MGRFTLKPLIDHDRVGENGLHSLFIVKNHCNKGFRVISVKLFEFQNLMVITAATHNEFCQQWGNNVAWVSSAMKGAPFCLLATWRGEAHAILHRGAREIKKEDQQPLQPRPSANGYGCHKVNREMGTRLENEVQSGQTTSRQFTGVGKGGAYQILSHDRLVF
ncbi:Polyadenylate-binding protein-interacting protein 3 [Datura stramonium]|uniref:Polyadenylate-binding protein-interacting protein 3 n=1 Tax=Datura stramonium TaxID=4076 RepID=A0ABS8RRH8_DATST|nr:Polyadenylate-binding protein-interacting protein 3 [Datura stramonium]